MVVPCSEVAMSDAEKESEARCKAMLNKLIAEVKRQTVEMEELAVRMDELAVGLKAVVQPPGAPAHALPPPVPAPTAICVTAVDHAVAAATPCAEAALAPELPTKCSTSGPDPNAGYAKVAAVSLLSRGATTALRAHAEPVNVTSSKSLATGELDNLMPARCSKMCSGDDTASPKSALMPDAAPGSPATAALLDVAITSPAPSLGAPRVCADTCIVAVHQLFDEMPPRVDVDHAVAEVTPCTDYALVNTHPYCGLPSVDAAEGSSWNPWHDQLMHQSNGGVVVVLQPWPPPTQEHLNWFNRFDERDQHEVIRRMLEVSGRQGRSSSCQVGSRLTIADGNPLYNELEVVEGMKLDRVVKVLELRSASASSPTLQTNVASIDWLGSKQVSRVDSSSHIVAHAYQHSHSFDAAGTAFDSAPSGRPWERGDLILRLATFKPLTWASEPKAASSLARARKGWVNVDMDRIECESCGAPLIFSALTSWSPAEVANAGEAFAEQLDASHQNSCPWRGNSCADSLVQLHLTQSALIGGFKEHCDGLLQFVYLPVIASSAIENMRLTRGLCGATVRIWDFRSVPRPSCFSPNSIDASAASGINEGVADGMESDHAEGRDEAANEESKLGVVLVSVSHPLVEQLTNGVPNTEAAVEVPVLKDTLNVENEVPAVGKEVHPPLEQTSVIVTEIPSPVKETRILKQVPVPLHEAPAILTESPPLKDTPAITIEQLPPMKENTATLKESPIEETPPKEAVTLSDFGTRMSFPPVIAQNVQSQNADGIAKKSTTRELAVENHDSTANVNDSISLIASYPAPNARLGENVMNKGSGSSDKTPVNAASSFQFFVIADEGLDLFVDLNSTPSDWVDSLKEEVCIPPGIHHSEPGNFSSFISSLASKDHHNTISPSGNIIVDKQNGGAEGIAPCTNSSLGSTGGENSRSEPCPPDTTAVNSLSSASTLPGTLVEISGSQEGVPVVSSCLTSNVQNNLSSDMMADALNNKVLPQESVDVSVWSERSNASLADDIIQPTGNKDTVSAGKTKVSVKIGCTQNVLVADTDKAAAFSSGDVVKSDSENSCPTSVGKQEMIDVPAGAQLTHNSDTHEVLMENEPVEAVPMEEDLGYGDRLSIG